MAGGGSKLTGLVERLADEVKLRVWLAEDSQTCVARGAGRILEDYDNLRELLVGLERGSTWH
jgi:rod shape-determining protein MreB